MKLAAYYAGGTNGVAKDVEEAVKWLRKAADLGSSDAASELGEKYDKGNGVTKDEVEAVKWFRKAADLGSSYAMFDLGVKYDKGDGVTKDEVEAVKWFRKAADLGLSGADNYLGLIYHYGRGLPKDEAEAVSWYRKAAELGDRLAEFNLGEMYRDGDGVDKDAKEAFQWFQQSAKLGYAAAQCEVASAYLNGLGVLQDMDKAAEWYFQAAKQGRGVAQVKLGLLYKDAADTPTNRIEAHKWFNLAAAQGDEDAKSLRDKIALKMSAPELAEARKRAAAFSAGDMPAEIVEIQTQGNRSTARTPSVSARTPDEIKFRNGAKKTERHDLVEIFQVVADGMLAHLVIGVSEGQAQAAISGNLKFDYSWPKTLVMFWRFPHGKVYDGQFLILTNYTIGTYQYDTVNKSSKTVPRLTTDINTAIDYQRNPSDQFFNQNP